MCVVGCFQHEVAAKYGEEIEDIWSSAHEKSASVGSEAWRLRWVRRLLAGCFGRTPCSRAALWLQQVLLGGEGGESSWSAFKLV